MKLVFDRVGLLILFLFILYLPVQAQTPVTYYVRVQVGQRPAQKFEFHVVHLLVNKVWVEYSLGHYQYDFPTPAQGKKYLEAIGDSMGLRSDVRNCLDTEFIDVLKKDTLVKTLARDSSRSYKLVITGSKPGDTTSYSIKIRRDSLNFSLQFQERGFTVDSAALVKPEATKIYPVLDSLGISDSITTRIVLRILAPVPVSGIHINVFFPSGKAANESMSFEMLQEMKVLTSCTIPDSVQFPGPKDTVLFMPLTNMIDMKNLNKMTLVLTTNAPLSKSTSDIAISINADLNDEQVVLLQQRTADIQDDTDGVLTWDLKPASEDTSFTFSIGTNFNFLSSLKLSGVYFEFTATVPDLIYGHLGIEAGFYQGNSSAKHKYSPLSGDSTVYSTTSINGFYLNPIWKCNSNFYCGFNIEFREMQTTDDSIISTGGTKLGNTPIPVDEFLIGPYFVFQYQDGDASFEVDVVPSMWNELGWSSRLQEPIKEWLRPFGYRGLYQIQIEELAHSIMLGGEVRAPSQGRPTQYMLYLTKEFPISKLADFINGIFD